MACRSTRPLVLIFCSLLIPHCIADFHPLYQAMLGDPTLRVHSLNYAPSSSSSSPSTNSTGKRNYTGLFVYPNFPGPFHAVIIAPDADGRNSFEDGKAIALARQGYAAMAADMRLMGEVEDGDVDTREVMLDQFLSAYQEVRKLPFIAKIAALGYGLGGLTMLDAVRLRAANLSVAICIHCIVRPLNPNLLQSRPTSDQINFDTKLLIMDGWRDPLNPKDIVDQVLEELDRFDIDWQLHRFSRAKHAFTIPHSDVENITQYNPQANQHSWVETLMFLESMMRV